MSKTIGGWGNVCKDGAFGRTRAYNLHLSIAKYALGGRGKHARVRDEAMGGDYNTMQFMRKVVGNGEARAIAVGPPGWDVGVVAYSAS
jgi:hypothetical protein